jgi:hypothetical protein
MDNLTKGNCVENFCDINETIKHPFSNRGHPENIWRVVQIATGITPHSLIRHMLVH